ncbi:4-carboxy-2-hydroxymuconate-6-semialdehyde dehydrogenase [Symmachiella dynata]|uniref:Gfo/Idh/MocA family protein n=1 Tax=Symmachiella dynata TaxID=2527995 RepID=UPI00118A5C8C|nr:Gfo/Idh/MocA family oxidoreductase [Symmachiella dynata]QDT49304.1 4-carboxy-2-hydroxymuconate-6-semialdehyde dehydrogenase [Symmachiella dynata]
MPQSNPRKILIVGGGSIGERHLRCFRDIDNDAEVGLCDVREEIRSQLAQRYGLAKTFADLSEATQQHWDAAVICTPAHLHVAHAVALAEHADALMIEKPLSTSLDDIPRLRGAWAGRVVNIAYVLRVNPLVQAAKQILESGEMGDLLEVVASSGQHFPTFRPAYREIYYTRHETGGGAIQDAATHQFNMVQYLAGDFDWVFCDSGHQALEGVEVEDTVHLTGRTGGGRTMVNASLNQFMAPNETVVRLNCRGGSVKLVFHEQNIGTLRHGDDDWTWNPPAKLERDDLFREQARRFLAAADGQEPVRCTLDEAEHTLKVNLAALKSAGRERVEIV